MKQRLFFQCAYDGTNYSGWQKQINANTIQEEIESKFSKLFSNKPIQIIGSGRTDAGVHAKKTFFHSDLPDLYSLQDLQYKLNNLLPCSIAIDGIFPVSENAHARFDATKRTYNYFLHSKKMPFNQLYSWFQPHSLNLEKMNIAAQMLIGKHDFTSFSKLHTDVNNNFCNVFYAEWKRNGEQYCFEISANRFLRNMVRAIVGTTVEIGMGNAEPEDIKKIMNAKDRGKAGFSVPAKGLFLINVEYPYI